MLKEEKAALCSGSTALSVELGLVSQHAHRCIDVARISFADTALQLQIHFFTASRIFLPEDLGIDRRLTVSPVAALGRWLRGSAGEPRLMTGS
jgi:hypothetical protein